VKRVALAMAALVLAGGCGGQRIKEWLSPTPTVVLIGRLRSEQSDERREAAHAVAADREARKDPSVVQIFCLLARSDEDPLVRSAAARGLANMESEEVVPALSQVAASDKSPYVRCDAVASLGRQAKPECVPPLVRAVQSDSSAEVRTAAASALRQFKDVAAAKALVAALDDLSLGVAQKAWESLRYMTGQNLPRQVQPWDDFLASTQEPFAVYGNPPPMPKGENQRPHFTKGPKDFIRGLFAKDVREAELE
jgi:HEAT repeat protein